MRDALADIWEEIRSKVHWYAGSMVAHMLVLGACLLILGRMHSTRAESPVSFAPANDDLRPRAPFEQIEMAAAAPLETGELSTDDLVHRQFKTPGGATVVGNPDAGGPGGGRPNLTGPDGFGMGGFEVSVTGPGPKIRGAGGIGAGRGTGDQFGSGGNQSGFAGRTPGMRGGLLGGGRRHEANRNRRDCRVELVCSPRQWRWKLEPVAVRFALHRAGLFGSGVGRFGCRRHGGVDSAVSRRGANAQIQRPISGPYQ